MLGTKFSRLGSATLELVFCMPILLALIVGIVWLGSAVIAQTEVTVEARHKTWEKRSDPTGTALLFLKDDIAKEKAKKSVQVSPVFDDVESPESAHDVMTGAWDHSKLPLDKAPNWKQYVLAAANAKTGSIQTNYVDASNKFTNFKNQARNIWRSIGANLIRQLTSMGDSVKGLLKNGESAESAEKAKERNQIEQSIRDKKQELRDAEEDVRNTDKDTSDALGKVLKNRVKRLKSDIKNLEEDLEALE
jgi:hypothetical protein